MEVVHCKDCAWFAPLESVPVAEKMHKKLHELFDDILPVREGVSGVCTRFSLSQKVPLLTKENGFCQWAEQKENSCI